MKYGLIGEKLKHSYSKIIHEMLGEYQYDLCPLTPRQVEQFMTQKQWNAINVTIPYKQTVMPFLDSIDDHAKAIGAVNTIVNKNGRLEGHNTDFGGFLYLVKAHGVSLKGKHMLVLGSGGTHKPVTAVCKAEGAASILTVSRHPKEGEISYEDCKNHPEIEIIVNTTPVGMYPQNGNCMVEMQWFPQCQAVFDAIYNPFRTELLLRAEEAGILAVNGFEMLVAQAIYAAEFFMNRSIPHTEIERICQTLKQQISNLVLIGMPSCGKSAMGRACSRLLGKKFVDLDAEAEKVAGMSIAKLFEKQGEQAFRELETQLCKKFGAGNGMVISTGGGVVKNADNLRALRQNGVIVFVDRPVDQLTVGNGRPLSTSKEALCQMEQQRRPLYESAADKIVKNHGDFDAVVAQIKEAFYEVSGA